MYHKDIRCTDCHDPHTARLKHEGNEVCTSCHQHPAGKYDGPSHHHHKPDSTGASCVECHMPQTTYMDVDPRRDHSLRIPRPDLSVELDTPNACTRCHIDKEEAGFEDRDDLRQYLDWVLAARDGDQAVAQELDRIDQEMADAYIEWYGDNSPNKREQELAAHYARTIDAAYRGDPEAQQPLIDLAKNGRVASVLRATALMQLGQYATPESIQACLRLLEDPDPQVRATAAGNLQAQLPPAQAVKELAPLLDDPVRLVRTEAARVLAATPGTELHGSRRRKLKAAIDELRAGLLLSNDRAAAHMTLGILYESLGNDRSARDAYHAAIRVEPSATGPRTNLAALHDRLADMAQQRARQAYQMRDQQAAVKFMAEAERHGSRAAQLRNEELEHLARDVRLLPESAGLQYRYGMALYLARRLDEAEQALLTAHQLEPQNPQFLLGIVLFYQQAKVYDKAFRLAEQLVALRPNDRMFRQVRDDIARALKETGELQPSAP
jgi:tetratricopeptide (TPR) repeat protein